MTLAMGKICPTQTWGGRLAELERKERQPAPAAVTTRLADDWLLREIILAFFCPILPSIVLSRTFGGRSIGIAGPLPDSWELKNRRRVALIDKKFQEGLSLAEDAELNELQVEHGTYLDAIQPPPFDKLEELEAVARQLNTTPRHLLLP
jgi:hypothetical protein